MGGFRGGRLEYVIFYYESKFKIKRIKNFYSESKFKIFLSRWGGGGGRGGYSK